MEPAPVQDAYSLNSDGSGETPLETAARLEAAPRRAAGEADRQQEREADVLVADIDRYVAETDPASLLDAEQALDAWEIPTDPLDGVPTDTVFAPNIEGEPPLVPIFLAQTEAEANIVRGLLEAAGIPVAVNRLSSPALGGVFQPDETRWGDLLVSASHAAAAQAVIADAAAAGAAHIAANQEDTYA